jgi:hypothetical protein
MMTPRLIQIAARRITTSAPRRAEVPAGYAKIKEIQKEFQIDNGLRIHERGGAANKMVYMATKGLILVGTVLFCDFIWKETKLGISLGLGDPKA